MKLVCIVFLFLTLFTKSTMGDRKAVGGYQRMDTDDLENEEVVKAAAFAVQALTEAQQDRSYTFMDEHNLSLINDNGDIHVIRGFRQVVAGMNYRLILAITRPPTSQDNEEGRQCIGAFAVTIYDRFGDLSVTRWGKEIDCTRAMTALEDDDALNDALADHFSG